MKLLPHKYQLDAARFMILNPISALFADPGTGKTAILLMTLHQLKKAKVLDTPVLITAPLRIATQVWPDEIAKWDQFNHFSFKVLHGRRKKELATETADLHIVNNEGLPWLSKSSHFDQYRTLIIDESSKFKNWSAQRTKILRYKLKQFTRRHILTGSPTPRSLLDLFSQMYLCDGGQSLGIYLTHYRHRYFVDMGFHGMFPDWQPREDAEEKIYKAIAPRCYRLDGSELLKTPEMMVTDVMIDIGKEFKNLSLESLKKLDLTLPLSGASEYGQARQIAGGVLVGGRKVHDHKIRALHDLVGELQGKPLLVFFHYRAEGDWLREAFSAPVIYGGTSPQESKTYIDDWNAGKLRMLIVNPASAGHGLNLQFGGRHIAWFSFTDNQDDYYQANRRIHGRQGIGAHVHRLIARGTVDQAIVRGLEAKTGKQQALLDAIKELTKCAQ